MNSVLEKTIYEISKTVLNAFQFSISRYGRIDSANDEGRFIHNFASIMGQIGYPVIKAKARHWYDLKICDIPVNLKLTSCKCADNAFNKKSIAYTLIGDIETVEKLRETNYDEWFSKIKKYFENMPSQRNPVKYEYYYLVINKTTKEVLFKSILDIHTYKKNSSGNVLQIDWKNEFQNKSYTSTDGRGKMRELLNNVQQAIIEEVQKSKSFREYKF